MWDIESGQCVRILPHRGSLTNAFFTAKFHHFDAAKFQPCVIVGTFEKRKAETDMRADVLVSEAAVEREIVTAEPVYENILARHELHTLTRINQQLYSFAVDKIMKKIK